MKNFLITFFGIILIPVWLVVIMLHLVLYPVVQKIRRKKEEKNSYWNEDIYKSDRLNVYLTRSHDLMYSIYHRYEDPYWDEYDGKQYAKEIVIHFAGISLFFNYGSDFLKRDNWSQESKFKYYGLYCIDGWTRHGWDCLWWGKHMYDLPWRRCKHTGSYIWKKEINELFDKEIVKECIKTHPDTPYPFFRVDEDVIYINKNNEKQHVPRIEWSLEEWRWESPLLRWLGIGHVFPKRRIYLEFYCDNNGDKEFSGLGTGASSWKGGTYSTSIHITKKDEPELYKMYKSLVWKDNWDFDRLNKFRNMLNERIDRFMTQDKIY